VLKPGLNCLKKEAELTARPTAALLGALKQRGLLDESLITWGGEFGRTAYRQNSLGGGIGRDHHPRCFTAWLAGQVVKEVLA
jgi:hypothetical protein